MNNVKIFLVLVLCWFVIFTSCHKEQNTYEPARISEPVNTSELANSPAVYSSQPECTALTLPVDISAVQFCLEKLENYLAFNKNGLEMPYIKALYQDDSIDYNNHVDKEYAWRKFYLDVAEYDLNGDGEMDYVIKRPDSERSGGNYFDEGFLDVVYQSDGELKRMHTDIGLVNVNFPIAILSTATNEFRDIAVKFDSSYKHVYKYNGFFYEEKEFSNEKRVRYDRILSSAYINAKLENDTINLRYNFRMFSDNDSIDYRFFVAGYFITAEKNGIVKRNRLWACDESGEPKMFSTKELFQNNFGWIDALFCSEYAGADLSMYTDDLIWIDEAEIIICEP